LLSLRSPPQRVCHHPASAVFPSVCLFFTDAAPTVISPLSLHDALPIPPPIPALVPAVTRPQAGPLQLTSLYAGPEPRVFCPGRRDRKSTRLNSSHQIISYAVFCLKKKTRP